MTQEQISEYLQQQTFVAFDTETTGMWAPINQLVEIAAVKFKLVDSQKEEFQSLVNPEREIPQDVIEIHGITNEMVKNAPTLKSILTQFRDFCGNDSILIAHNAPFDISFIGNSLNRLGLKGGKNLILDTVDIYRRFFPDLRSYSLQNLIKHFHIAQEQQHRALSDALMVVLLFQKALTKFPPINCRDDFKKFMITYTMSHWKQNLSKLPESYADFNEAIEKKLKVEIDYDPPQKASQKRIIHPQQVYKLGSIYYISSYCELAQAERVFRLDRILKYKVLN
ncbi:MAG: WYL domain-containing protein [FCB group bacterium]|nr:WYL domain-containing protein [FCB group bacterium]